MPHCLACIHCSVRFSEHNCTSPSSVIAAGGALKWPVFKWAGGKDDQFFARLGKNAISIYQAPEMGLLDKKSFKVDGGQDFEWSPSEPIIACVTQEQNNLPARIALIKVPERIELRQKNLFSVSGAPALIV